MLTALLILLAVLVVLGMAAVVYQMATSGWMCVAHAFNGTLEVLGKLLVAVIEAIGKVNE